MCIMAAAFEHASIWNQGKMATWDQKLLVIVPFS